MLSAKLVVRGGKHDGRTIPLPKGRFLIGREQDCNLRPASDLVSRHHCVFHVDDFTVRLRDLGSTNGTLVNGDPLTGEKGLKAGDKVEVGKLTFEVALSDVAEAPAEPPADQGTLDDTGAHSDGSTTYEIPASQVGADTRFAPGAGVPAGGDTGMFPAYGGQPGQSGAYPPPGYGYPPQGYPQQMPQGGYPPQPYGYPQQMPQGYPQQYAYPQQGFAPQGFPPAQTPPGPGAGGGQEESKAPPVKLPPPPQKK